MSNQFLFLRILALLALTNAESSIPLGQVNVNEWFSKKIDAKLFNLTIEQPDQYEYQFSLKNYPDLPSWMRFMYSTEYQSGYLYGTPPEKLGDRKVSESFFLIFPNLILTFLNQ